MRRFFLLGVDSEASGVHAVVPNYPVFDLYFEDSQIKKCQRVQDDFLVEAQLLEKPGNRVDMVGNPLNWPIVSPAMLNVFEDFAKEDIQALRLNVINSSGVAVLTNYRVINVLLCLDQTVDLERSVTSCHLIGGENQLYVISPVFRVDKIPQDIHVFRPNERLSHLVVSQEFGRAIRKAKLKGIVLVETGSV